MFQNSLRRPLLTGDSSNSAANNINQHAEVLDTQSNENWPDALFALLKQVVVGEKTNEKALYYNRSNRTSQWLAVNEFRAGQHVYHEGLNQIYRHLDDYMSGQQDAEAQQALLESLSANFQYLRNDSDNPTCMFYSSESPIENALRDDESPSMCCFKLYNLSVLHQQPRSCAIWFILGFSIASGSLTCLTLQATKLFSASSLHFWTHWWAITTARYYSFNEFGTYILSSSLSGGLVNCPSLYLLWPINWKLVSSHCCNALSAICCMPCLIWNAVMLSSDPDPVPASVTQVAPPSVDLSMSHLIVAMKQNSLIFEALHPPADASEDLVTANLIVGGNERPVIAQVMRR